MSDALIDKYTSLGIAENTAVANMARSGQLGTGIRFPLLDGATPAVFPPAVGFVLQLPSMWDSYPARQDTLKALVETHGKWSGIDVSYSLETGDSMQYRDGQSMKVPLKTTRSPVNPSFSFMELSGNPGWNLFRKWLFDISHPDTNMSVLSAVMTNRGDIPGWYMSAYSMTMLFVQPDPSGIPDRIMDAVIITNMFPTEIGELGIQRNIGTVETKERSISFTGLLQHNENTRLLGVAMMEEAKIHTINYDFAPAGLAGSVDPKVAVDSKIYNMGGLMYEAGSTNAVQGANQQYLYGNEDPRTAFASTYEGDEPVPATGASIAH